MSKLNDWCWNDDSPNRDFDNYIRESGLQKLKNISYRSSNRILISAFVERWQPETNTFHMPYGEITIILNDVPIPEGLPVTKNSVNTLNFRLVDAKDMVVNLLDVSLQEAHDELAMIRGQSIRLEWLRDNFSHVTNVDPISVYSAVLEIICCTL